MVLGHGSGVDDILLFIIPVSIAVFALRSAEKRAQARLDAEESSGGDHPVADPAP
ncbi:MAG: hypothetical protein ACFCVC_16470 [Acidimicrobiia bacterium]